MTNPEATLTKAQALIESKEYSKARALLMGLLPNALSLEDRASRAALLVHCLQSTGANELARQTLDAELIANPKSLDLWLLSSHLYAEQNDAKEVEKALQKAVKNCNAPEAGLALASFLSHENREPEARLAYQKMIRQWPTHPDVLFEYASLLERMGENEEAQKTWQSLCQSNPDDTEAWLHLAISLSDAGDMEAARKAFDTAKQLEPNNIIIWYNRAVAESRSENLVGVRQCADALQRLAPNAARTHLVTAWATEDRRTSRKHTMSAINSSLSEEVDPDDADMILCAALSHLKDLQLIEDFNSSFRDALRAEKAGPETLGVHRQYSGSSLTKPKLFRFTFSLPDSFRDEQVPQKFPLRHLDVIASTQAKAIQLAHQLETLAGGDKWPVVGEVEVTPAPKDEKEGVVYRSQPCYHDELPA
jgi:tetratricopeptide (TPR) repeat protein